MSTEQSKPYTILQLLSEDIEYQIPVYQRNYAWGRPQIRALIQDIYDYYLKSQISDENYYIGSLVVAKKIITLKDWVDSNDLQTKTITLKY